ncbi:hypothetical protein C8R42DRAFT_724413 [Lentinula raphanica]|nr:hypothetical protein C8R42DRAFT_724413 [Lentinula raphanica]
MGLGFFLGPNIRSNFAPAFANSHLYLPLPSASTKVDTHRELITRILGDDWFTVQSCLLPRGHKYIHNDRTPISEQLKEHIANVEDVTSLGRQLMDSAHAVIAQNILGRSYPSIRYLHPPPHSSPCSISSRSLLETDPTILHLGIPYFRPASSILNQLQDDD